MDLTLLDNKRLAVLLTDDSGESAVFAGRLRWDGSTLALDRGAKPQFDLRPEWYDRIKPVKDDEARRTLLDSDYYLPLLIGTLQNSENEAEYEKTGLQWPDK